MRNHRDDEEILMLGVDRLVLRPIRSEDRHAYASFIDRIESADLRRRFFHRDGLSPEIDFERCVSIDDENEVAFVAVRESQQGHEEIVGEARLYRYPEAAAAELAIIVQSDMHRRGLGRALMRKAIEYCTTHGLEMIAQILSSNDAMIGLAKSVGMEVEYTPGSDLAVAHMPAGR
jgi:acetyltransferase